jgi:hypothetical protein
MFVTVTMCCIRVTGWFYIVSSYTLYYVINLISVVTIIQIIRRQRLT